MPPWPSCARFEVRSLTFIGADTGPRAVLVRRVACVARCRGDPLAMRTAVAGLLLHAPRTRARSLPDKRGSSPDLPYLSIRW